MIDGKNVEGELKVQNAFTFYFAIIGENTASSVSPSSSLPDFRSYLGPACPKSMALEPLSGAEINRIVNGSRGSFPLAQTVFRLRLSSLFFLSLSVPSRDLSIFLLKMVSSQVL